MLYGYSFLLQSIFGEVKLKLKRLFLFQLFVASFITLFCVLGTWQLQRLQWKMELISEITFGLNSTPITYTNSIKKNYQRIVSEGSYDFKDQIYLYSLNDKGKPGFDVITPFKTISNETVLVNRGWIPKEKKKISEINSIKNNIKITGLLRKIYKANIFKPENDLENNIWFSVNLDDLKMFTGNKFSNFIVYLEDSNMKAPLPKKITVDVPNNHLKYAITWYSIAISILLYYLYFRKKK
ncbi:SURF1 family protein [Pelagibacteraceae bacterium]|nr:SURF1 family protein [Pelagibacteraceae bacterium]